MRSPAIFFTAAFVITVSCCEPVKAGAVDADASTSHPANPPKRAVPTHIIERARKTAPASQYPDPFLEYPTSAAPDKKDSPTPQFLLDYPNAAPAQSLEAARIEYSHGNFATALKIYSSLAEIGNAEAQLAEGNYFWNGNATRPDHRKAVFWWTKAANQGNAEAQCSLGLMYLDGEGIPQDFEKAIIWLRKAAEQDWYVAQERLGTIYEAGLGVTKDEIQAYMWYNLAASHVDDRILRSQYIKKRDEIALKMTSEQIREAQRLATAWISK